MERFLHLMSNIMTRDFFEHQSRTLNALYEVSRVLGSSLDLGLVARRCLRALSDNLDLERGILLMPTPDRTTLAIKASFGVPPDELSQIFPVQGGFLGKVYATILRWNREDDARRQAQGSGPAEASSTPQDAAVSAEITGQV